MFISEILLCCWKKVNGSISDYIMPDTANACIFVVGICPSIFSCESGAPFFKKTNDLCFPHVENHLNDAIFDLD